MITSQWITFFLKRDYMYIECTCWSICTKKLCIDDSKCNEQVHKNAISLFITRSLKIYQKIPYEANRILSYLNKKTLSIKDKALQRKNYHVYTCRRAPWLRCQYK